MFRKVLTVIKPRVLLPSLRKVHTKLEVVKQSETNIEVIDTSLVTDDLIDVKKGSKSPLEKCEEDISHVAPYLKPTFNFAAYANKSETLQELIKLGVNLHKIEKDRSVSLYILGLDFERDIKNHIRFLHETGLDLEAVAEFITKCPLIFKEDLENLAVRINYLRYKKFSDETIVRIISKNPSWLTYNTKEIDHKLGLFQKQFALKGSEVRELAGKNPKLITHNWKKVTVNNFALKEEMGFDNDQIKEMVLSKPKILMKDQKHMLDTFEYVHKTMGISTEMITKFPSILTYRKFRVEQRHEFLKKLGRAQYDPKISNYVSLLTLVTGNDGYFATEIAKSSIQEYNTFLKSL